MPSNEKQEKPTTASLAEYLVANGYKYINGRLYYGNEFIQVTKAYKHILDHNEIIRQTIVKIIHDGKSLINLLNTMSLLIPEDEYLWPDNQLICDIKNNKDIPTKEEVLNIFPFSIEQLVLLNKILFDNRNERSLFLITGVGGSGKSTFGNLVCQFFPNDVAHVMISELQGFTLGPALKSKLIYSDELGSKDIDNAYLKKICSRQPIQCNNKYGGIETIIPQSNMLYCCNKLPILDITDSGLFRRICFLHMNTKIANPDPEKNHHKFTTEELVKIGTYVYNMEVPSDWFEKYFEKQTFDLIWKDSKLYNVCQKKKVKLHDLTYSDFKTTCFSMNLKPYAETTFDDLKEVFTQWKNSIDQKES